MGIVKLALAGPAGIQDTEVELGRAVVVYDPAQISAEDVVTVVNDETQFTATLEADGPAAAPPRQSKRDCWLSWWC